MASSTDRHEHRPYGTGRVSAQRREITEMTDAMPGAFTIDDLVRALGVSSVPVGAATVYRAVASMAESGWLQRVGERNNGALYVRCTGGAHHHHLVCTGCGRVARTSCPLDDSASSWAEESGFTITHHDVTLYGLCSQCQLDSIGSAD
ncbi:MAG: transcriptional repressor [Actinomycetota bacterium]|nr:transcriptional repressor [Actinomycetota bacterium]